MFYTRLITLCKQCGVKPTPLIKELGYSAGNIKRWENGATVNSDILVALAEHFKVSVDYLLGRTETPFIEHDELSADEIKLVTDYRELSEQGKGYITETMIMAKDRFKKEQSVHQSVEQVG